MGHRPPPPCINIVNIMWEWGLVSRGGGDVAEAKKKRPETMAIRSWLCYMNVFVLWKIQGFAIFA